jgi:hypothetical protein
MNFRVQIGRNNRCAGRKNGQLLWAVLLYRPATRHIMESELFELAERLLEAGGNRVRYAYETVKELSQSV